MNLNYLIQSQAPLIHSFIWQKTADIFSQSYIYPILSFEDDEKLFQSWQNFPDRYGARAL